MITLKELVLSDKVLIAAHRGSSGSAPENTIPAFEQAIDSGAEMIEVDVQITCDGALVVHHDGQMGIKGSELKHINDMTLEEVLKEDVGSWFSEEYAHLRTPLLNEVLDLVRDKAYLVIEIKRARNNYHECLIEELARLIAEHNYEPYTLAASFDYELLARIKKNYPFLHTAAIGIPGETALPSQIANAICCEAYICHASELNEIMTDDAARNGIFVGVYGADSPEDIDNCLKLGIKVLGTNYPDMVREFLDSADNKK